MNYEIKLRYQKEFKENPDTYKGSCVGSGWVEMDSAIKFPVYILRTKDNKRMFVKYPQIKTEDGYLDIIYPLDKATRQELNMKILKAFQKLVTKGFDNPEISDVKITIPKQDMQYGKIAVKGYASIRIENFVIRNIAIKESDNGLFVQMPQYKDQDGEYHDLVYGTNDFMQIRIKNEVLDAYKMEKELQQKAVQKVSGKEIKKNIVPKL